MSAPNSPLTFDELSEQYRVEMKNNSLAEARKDLYPAMAELITECRRNWERESAKDPDSIMAEGADQRRKRVDRLVKSIVSTRTKKIALMAIRAAEGAKTPVDYLTPEEKAYFDSVTEITRKQLGEIDRLRGKKVVLETKIDEPAPVVIVEPEEPAKMVVEVIEGAPSEDFPMPDMPDDEFVPEDDPIPDADDFEPPMEEPMEAPILETVETVEFDSENVLVRVINDIKPFSGPDRDYSLQREDVVVLPKVLADVLLKTGDVVAIVPTP